MWFEKLKEAGIRFGIESEKVEELAALPESRWPDDVVVAVGKTGRAAGDVKIVRHYETVKKVEVQGGAANFFNLGYGVDVHAGQLLAEQDVDIEGEKGMNVYGEDIAPSRPSSTQTLGFNAGVSVEKKAGFTRFYARIDGVLLNRELDQLQVIPELVLDEAVGPRTGHLNLRAPICVRGDVLAGFSVRSLSSIKIEGGVETGATVEAGSRLEIGRGVSEKAHLRSAGDMDLKFASGARIECGGDLRVESYLHQCDAYAKGNIFQTRPSPGDSTRGAVVGGTLNAFGSIELQSAGSELSLTTLTAGFDAKSWTEVKQLRGQVQVLEGEINRLLRGVDVHVPGGGLREKLQGLKPERREVALRVLGRVRELVGYRKSAVENLGLLEQAAQQENPGAVVRVKQFLIPDVDVMIRRCSLKVRSRLGPVLLSEMDGRISPE